MTETDILSFLAANGVQVSYQSTGAIRLPNGDTAFVTEKDGKITIKHPPRGGRAQTYYQKFTSRERALKAILAYAPKKKLFLL